jgi:hypothetical protein
MPLERSDQGVAWVLGRVSCPGTKIALFPNLPCPARTGDAMDTSLPNLQVQAELETRVDPETFLLFPLPFSPSLQKLWVKG